MGGQVPTGADDDGPGTAPESGSPSASDAGSDGLATTPTRRSPSMAFVLTAFAVMALLTTGWAFLEVSRGGDSAAPGSSQKTAEPISEIAVADRGSPVQLSGATLTDDRLDVADLRGQVVVLNVWGSWCVPCRKEAPTLARVSSDYAGRGVRFVGVNIKDNRAAAVAFEQRYGITYPSIEDRDSQAMLALSQYAPAQAVPVTLVLDREGRVASRVIGVVREATLRALLDSTLAEEQVS